MSLITFAGGCHCGAVRFQVSADPDTETVADCNCSICCKKGFLHLIVPPERFTLLSGEDALTTYTFNTGVAKHLFCKRCGIHSFYRPRSHPHQIDVNLRCLDDDPAIAQFQVIAFDGKQWEANVHQLQ
jgi:hypothetical protein